MSVLQPFVPQGNSGTLLIDSPLVRWRVGRGFLQVLTPQKKGAAMLVLKVPAFVPPLVSPFASTRNSNFPIVGPGSLDHNLYNTVHISIIRVIFCNICFFFPKFECVQADDEEAAMASSPVFESLRTRASLWCADVRSLFATKCVHCCMCASLCQVMMAGQQSDLNLEDIQTKQLVWAK